MSVTNVGDVPQQPINVDQAYVPDQLIAGEFKRVTANANIAGNTTYARGTVMGQQTLGAAAAVFTGTGNGAISAITLLKNAKQGIYTMNATVAGANSATFRLTDPNGVVLGDFAFSGAGAHLTVADQLSFTITDGGTDFIVGDSFAITVAAGAGNYIESVSTATDGSQVPSAVLADYTDSTVAATVIAGLYLSGEFNSTAITFDSSWTLAALTTALRPFSIFLKSVSSATDPSGE